MLSSAGRHASGLFQQQVFSIREDAQLLDIPKG
jgi:hypothetical protein